MIVFMDFEASSLGKHSYPVEIAWAFEDGRSRTFLIRPVENWTDWSSDAEAIHGISRERLTAEGMPVATVVDEMLAALSDQDLYASSPSWDGKWLSVLLRAAGQPRHALRLRKSDEAFMDIARTVLGASVAEDDIARLVDDVLRSTEPERVAHRALPDALLELERFNRVRREAQAHARRQQRSL